MFHTLTKMNKLKRICSGFFLMLFAIAGFAQDSASIYKNMKVIEIRSRGTTGESTFINGVGVYKVDDKAATKKQYDEFIEESEKQFRCTPCILKVYDKAENLTMVAQFYVECFSGYFRSYYPNGVLQDSGSYKGVDFSKPDDIDFSKCNIKIGKWRHSNQTGDSVYYEFWDNGKFVKQVPPQNKTEIWKTELLIDKIPVKDYTVSLSPAQVKLLNFKIQYKNKLRENVLLTMKLEISCAGYPIFKLDIPFNDFKNIDIKKVIKDSGIPEKEIRCIYLQVFNNENAIAGYCLQVKP